MSITTLKSGIRRAAISTPPQGRPAYVAEPESPALLAHLSHVERREILVKELVSRTLFEESKKRQLREFQGVAAAGKDFLRALRAVAVARAARQSTAAAIYDLEAGL